MSYYGMSEEEAQNYWAKGFFKGKCPYTNKECKDWNCHKCEIEKEERGWAKENKK